MIGWYSLEVMKANKLRRQAKEFYDQKVTKRPSASQQVRSHRARQKERRNGGRTEHLDFIQKRALWGEEPEFKQVGRGPASALRF
jgi:hypothetical protein